MYSTVKNDTLLNSALTNSPIGNVAGEYVAPLGIYQEMGLDFTGPAFNLWTRSSYEIPRLVVRTYVRL